MPQQSPARPLVSQAPTSMASPGCVKFWKEGVEINLFATVDYDVYQRY